MDVPASTTTAKSKESVAFCAPLCSVKDDYIGKSRIISLGGSSGSLGASLVRVQNILDLGLDGLLQVLLALLEGSVDELEGVPDPTMIQPMENACVLNPTIGENQSRSNRPDAIHS
jgi:hypothetical protein